MKKILIIGDNLHSKELIDVAKANGVHTVITDNKAFVESQSKKIADEYWDISVTDINELEKKAKEEGIDGITCGASELCLATVRELCKRLRLPFWIDDNAWEIINNKKRFKELCRECGLPVAKDYKLDISFKQVDLEKIEYPVIVKPADGSSSIGVHVCTNEKELKEGYQDAYSSSKAKKVVVERYYSGLEVQLLFAFHEGKAYLATTGDTYGDKKSNNTIVFASGPTRQMLRFEKEWKEPAEKLFRKLKCNKGIGFIQIVLDGNDAAVMEMNYRLPGIHNNMDSLMYKCMMDCALGENTVTEQDLSYHSFDQFCYALWLKPGTISRIEGVDDIKIKMNSLHITITKKVGDVISDNEGMRRIFAYLISMNNNDEIKNNIEYINETVKVFDIDGNDMIYKYTYSS